jgi:hypothetical protein
LVTNDVEAALSRRAILKSAIAVAAGGIVYGCAPRAIETAARPAAPIPLPPIAQPVFQPEPPRPAVPLGVRPALFENAMAALERHGNRVLYKDRIAIADFAWPSSQRRFHVVDLKTNQAQTMLVAHGMGSDPDHTGYLLRFSNDPGSNATSEGCFLAADYYIGVHGQSQRLYGLDPTNSNALDRAIVIHSAAYANPDMIAQFGKLGRSQGCFAVGDADLYRVFESLGQGRMVYAAKV